MWMWSYDYKGHISVGVLCISTLACVKTWALHAFCQVSTRIDQCPYKRELYVMCSVLLYFVIFLRLNTTVLRALNLRQVLHSWHDPVQKRKGMVLEPCVNEYDFVMETCGFSFALECYRKGRVLVAWLLEGHSSKGNNGILPIDSFVTLILHFIN